MSDGTHIEWTDATVNAVNGCSVVSPGCTNCYAMRLAGTRLRNHPSRVGLTTATKAGPVWNGKIHVNERAMLEPLRWRRPRNIFWNAHGDLFHPAVPDAVIDRCFAVMALTPLHVHQVLTKRPDRMRAYFDAHSPVLGRNVRAQIIWDLAFKMVPRPRFTVALEAQGCTGDNPLCFPFSNVWLGTSVEDQKRADERIPDLLATPAAVRFLSCEPLLGPVDLTSIDLAFVEAREKQPSGLTTLDALSGVHFDDVNGDISGVWGDPDPHIDWVICGGESGPGARPMHPDWARSLRDQCAAVGVPFFFKQWGAWVPHAEWLDQGSSIPWQAHVNGRWEQYEGGPLGDCVAKVGKKAAGRLLDGVTHDGMPA